EFLNERKFFDQSSHQRAAIEFIERRAGEKLARDAADQIGGRIGDQIDQQRLIVEERVAKFVLRLRGGRLHRVEHSLEQPGILQRVKPIGGRDVFAEPIEKFGAGGLVLNVLSNALGTRRKQIRNFVQCSVRERV